MYHKKFYFLPVFLFFTVTSLGATPAFSQEEAETKQESCTISDTPCLLQDIIATIPSVETQEWKDETLKGVILSYAAIHDFASALPLVSQISSPDLKSKTIGEISKHVKDTETEQDKQKIIFTSIQVEAQKITDPNAFSNALTQLAIAQSQTLENSDVKKTLSLIENQAFLQRANAELANEYAKTNDIDNALSHLEAIDNPSVKNKGYETVAYTLLGNDHYNSAYDVAQKVSNTYVKNQIILTLIQKNRKADAK